ncbi:Gypsy retrotransposon integrase-like protein 1 [Podospora pseudopauciseta]|uniref:Gypsy retrotransposon integrase-like protein 1 n=1 Tax=Podospora pseudopauciseta TaxID=2093780 RepID=A0ABR0H0N1_9PEZI|nr:Gypsy retrotransposon integrase-like protein 1 [Podospora pseudopauciseta]
MTEPSVENKTRRRTRPSSQAPQPNRRSANSPPGMSDDESADLSQEEHGSPTESLKSAAQDTSKVDSEAPESQDGTGDAPSMPLQKRRRVTRACDECRRKKIKCDGKQPCTHCSVYSYECTYDKPSNRRRNPAPQYIEALEARLQRAETLLRKFMPDVDLSDPNLDPSVQQEFRNRQNARAQAAKAKSDTPPAQEKTESQDAQIMSMIESIGQLDINEGGEWDFHGNSSGAVFLRRMKEHFEGLLGNDYRIPFLPRPSRPAGMFSLDSPRSNAGSPWEPSTASNTPAPPNIYDLPAQDRARTLCYYSFNCATCLLRVVHQPSFYEKFDKLYSTPQEAWGNDEHRFLGLLYSVLALGCVYDVSDVEAGDGPSSYKAAVEQGIKYYTSARMILQDVAECRDMVSLQGLVYMILFLQATSNISGCYAFLGIALRSSLRMGLHRHLAHEKITPIEDETRRRVFHVVRQMDIYISAILGFPLLLHDDDVDQPMPTEVDDEYITSEAILTPPPGTPSFFEAFNAHTRLMAILTKVVKYIYPVKAVEDCVNQGRVNSRYMISYARIKEIEAELQEWHEQLPTHWRPSPDGPIEVIRVRTLLRFGYAHVQMMLYRPFLHYISPRQTAGKKIDDRYYNCAAAGVSVSRNIVHIGIEIRKQAVLIGPYWFILYSQFFAILSLIYYVLENPDKAGAAEILADAKAGREVIASLAQRSLAADRITNALNPLFEQLPERLKKASTRPMPSKKRAAPAGSKSSLVLPARPGVQDDVPQRRSEEVIRPPTGALRREARLPPQRTSSFDALGLPQGSLASQNFSNLQDLLPMDLTLGRGTPEARAAHMAPAPRHAQTFPQGHPQGANPVYKVDAMMFPTGDPFAYPNAPLMDPAGHHARPGHPHGLPGQPPAPSMQFYMPSIYDDIEGQLMGPIPPYLMSQGQGPPHTMSPATQMYNTANMIAMQPSPRHGQPHAPPQGLASHTGPHHQGQPQQRDMMEDIMGEPDFTTGEWDDMLQQNSGYR